MTDAHPSTIEQDALERLATLEAELAAVQSELDHTMRLATIGTIAAGVAHEVNNLLTPVLAYAQLAESRPDDRVLVNKAIAQTVSGIESAARILEAMLSFSSLPDEEARADIDATLNATLDLLARDLTKDMITLARQIDPGTCVALQPLALQQILANLLLNARRALRGCGGEIAISAAPTDDGMISIRVADNGPGIPPEIADSLFEPFVSVPVEEGEPEAGRSHDRRGSGLGLAVCRRIIESAGGRITAESAPGRGAAFTIRLRAAEPASEGR